MLLSEGVGMGWVRSEKQNGSLWRYTRGEKMTPNKVATAELEIKFWISCVYLETESMTWIWEVRKKEEIWITARFLGGLIEFMVTFAKMEKWKPDMVVKVQEFYGDTLFATSVCHQRGRTSAQAVKIPQELQQTNFQTFQVKLVLNIPGHLESRTIMLAFIFVFSPLFLKNNQVFQT